MSNPHPNTSAAMLEEWAQRCPEWAAHYYQGRTEQVDAAIWALWSNEVHRKLTHFLCNELADHYPVSTEDAPDVIADSFLRLREMSLHADSLDRESLLDRLFGYAFEIARDRASARRAVCEAATLPPNVDPLDLLLGQEWAQEIASEPVRWTETEPGIWEMWHPVSGWRSVYLALVA